MTKQEFKQMDLVIEDTRKRLLESASDVKSVVHFVVDAIKEALHEGLEED